MGEAADNFLRYATSIGGAVWIGSDDDLPHRVQLRATFADPKDAEHAVRFSLDMRLKDFGKTLSLAPPGESLALNEVFTEIFEKPQKRARDARRISDVKQLQLAAELYFDKNGAYPQDLSLMAPEFIRSIPVDSVRGTPPVYSASPDRKKYHMGTVLEDESNGALRNDADFNSEKAGWKNGFDGDDAGLCVETGGRADIEAACYDVVP